MNLFWKRIPKTTKFEQAMADRHEAYNSIVRLEESELLSEYKALAEINFKQDRKQFKKQEDYQQSPLYEKELRFKELCEDSDIKNYIKYENSESLSFAQRYKEVFYEEFSGQQLDESQWVPSYRWSYKQIQGCYSNEGEYQAYSEGNNTEVINGQLHIVTKRKDIDGRIWTKDKGFITKPFKYSSDIIAGESHLEKEGSVIIKFKIDGAKKPLQHFIRACDDKNQRCISLLESTTNRKFKVGHTEQTKTGLYSNISGLNLQKDFYLLELDWNKEIMSWRINGVLIHQDTTFPNMEKMHLIIGSKLNSEKGQEGKIIIDYIRIYGQR